MSEQNTVPLAQWRAKMLAKGPPPKPKRFTRWWWRLMANKVTWWRS